MLINRFAYDLKLVKADQQFASLFLAIWSGKRGSNSRPIPWQGIALPTELFPRFNNVCVVERTKL